MRTPYRPSVVRTVAPSELSDNAGGSEGRLQGRQDDEHGDEGLHGLIVYSLYFIYKSQRVHNKPVKALIAVLVVLAPLKAPSVPPGVVRAL